MTLAYRLDNITADDLRHRRGRKWLHEDPSALGAAIAESDLGTSPVVLDALHEAVTRQTFGYQTADMRRDLAEATAGWLTRRYGWTLDPGRIHPVADVVRALDLAIAHFSRPGSAVILPTPTYMPFLDLASRHGRPTIRVPMREHNGRPVLDLDMLDAAFRAGGNLLVLCNPHNPTGVVHTVAELAAIGEVVARHGGRVFADEIHAPITFGRATHIPYASVSDETASHTLTAVSASKAWNLPGLKCAQLVLTSDEDVTTWEPLAIEAHGASNLGLIAAIAAYGDRGSWLEQILDYLKVNRDVLHKGLMERVPALKVRPPDGTYLAWLDFRALGIERPGALLASKGLHVVEGIDCGPPGAGHARINFATPRPVLLQMLERVAEASSTRS
ncbi:pyridoxal phosphate-dependent aminotransferase [Aeromicrobium panaciterrae]|uniref:MalY/PatB family protein n=1 Tax=Aeromicrobium panaciterrae TaxID=363861 RepID=UPI0031DFC752